jgi:DNA-binding NarL/FixJ family response regulator
MHGPRGSDWGVRCLLVTDAAINTLLAQGHSMAAVGEQLGISAATVCRRVRATSA